jgi:hypothetical protein
MKIFELFKHKHFSSNICPQTGFSQFFSLFPPGLYKKNHALDKHIPFFQFCRLHLSPNVQTIHDDDDDDDVVDVGRQRMNALTFNPIVQI